MSPTAAVLMVGFWLLSLAGLVVHIVSCVKADWVAMLLVGLFIPPVGVIHGLGIILGIWG